MSSLPKKLDLAATALFLDVDGTLLEIRERPEDVVADVDLISLLQALSAAVNGALSLISGRPVAEIDRIFAPARFAAAGSHGAEIRLRPQDEVAITATLLPAGALAALTEFADAHDGVLVEHKRSGASLHYRMAPHLEARCRSLVDELMEALEADFRLIAGKMVFEIAPRAHDKGAAIRTMLEHAPFLHRRPVFVGDDVTDEDGFRSVNGMRGTSIRVGRERDTAAAYTLEDVAAVRRWLSSLMEQDSRQAGIGAELD